MELWPTKGSFAEDMVQHGLWGLYNARDHIDRLTPEHIEYSLACFLANRKNRRANKDIEYYALKVSQDVIRFFMGEERFLRDVLTRSDNFLGIPSQGEKSYRYMARVQSLATNLYNMQGVLGIEHRVKTLKGDDLESILGELDCALLIFHPEHDLRFNVPKKNARKGTCYDAEFTTLARRVIHCEFKAKATGTVMTAKTVEQTCADARTQLPKGKPGMIFLRLPEEWSSQPNFKKVIQPGLEKSVRQSDRLVAVVVAWEVWLTKGGPERLRLFLYDAWLNKRSALFGDDVATSINMFRYLPSSWFDIRQFIAAQIEELKLRIPIA